MNNVNVTCEKCGYETQREFEDVQRDNKCPICNAHGGLKMTPEGKELMFESQTVEHIKKAFEIFGIEGALQNFKTMSPKIQTYFETIIAKHFSSLKDV